jgi:hypothetical protein
VMRRWRDQPPLKAGRDFSRSPTQDGTGPGFQLQQGLS